MSDGKIRVAWLPAVANINAPTVAEINAGLRLDTVMTPDGLTVTAATADVDTSSLSSTFDTKRAGRRGFTLGVKIKRQDAADTALTTLVYRAVGFLYVRRTVDAGTAPTIADKCEIYPGECGQGTAAYGPNTIQSLDVPILNSADAAVAAVTA